MMIHPFHPDEIEGVVFPDLFTYPFCYEPHPLCRIASRKLQDYLETRTDWAEELGKGKMFGVLVVLTPQDEVGFLAAFSGLLAGSNCHDYFVPPVYDLLSPDGFFKAEEEKITSMNRRIEELEEQIHPYETKVKARLAQLREEAEEELRSAKQRMESAKIQRDARRKEGGLSDEEHSAMIRESQHLKAEYKRLEKRWEKRLLEEQRLMDDLWTPVVRLKERRKHDSMALQRRLFEQFRMLDARGEERDLCDIFQDTPQGVPPAGAGECAAPKLLQYAYRNGLKPLAMAEFWWGASPKSEVRIQGYYYPACKQKCGPILAHMLQGLKVEPNPLAQGKETDAEIRMVYEDEWLLVVDKPSGMLSVPGKEALPSVYKYIKEKYPEATGPLLVHRLDMDTSGLLLIAKRKEVHEMLQMQFEGRRVKKRYVALLDGEWPATLPTQGFIRLPIRPDYENRPYQVVDEKDGKPAITRYEVLGEEQQTVDGQVHTFTRVAYYPQTGRTHQLRVHSAHPLGVGRFIRGDRLYGKPADRLYLHAERLEFRHPLTGKWMKLEVEVPF